MNPILENIWDRLTKEKLRLDEDGKPYVKEYGLTGGYRYPIHERVRRINEREFITECGKKFRTKENGYIIWEK